MVQERLGPVETPTKIRPPPADVRPAGQGMPPEEATVHRPRVQTAKIPGARMEARRMRMPTARRRTS